MLSFELKSWAGFQDITDSSSGNRPCRAAHGESECEMFCMIHLTHFSLLSPFGCCFLGTDTDVDKFTYAYVYTTPLSPIFLSRKLWLEGSIFWMVKWCNGGIAWPAAVIPVWRSLTGGASWTEPASATDTSIWSCWSWGQHLMKTNGIGWNPQGVKRIERSLDFEWYADPGYWAKKTLDQTGKSDIRVRVPPTYHKTSPKHDPFVLIGPNLWRGPDQPVLFPGDSLSHGTDRPSDQAWFPTSSEVAENEMMLSLTLNSYGYKEDGSMEEQGVAYHTTLPQWIRIGKRFQISGSCVTFHIVGSLLTTGLPPQRNTSSLSSVTLSFTHWLFSHGAAIKVGLRILWQWSGNVNGWQSVSLGDWMPQRRCPLCVRDWWFQIGDNFCPSKQPMVWKKRVSTERRAQYCSQGMQETCTSNQSSLLYFATQVEAISKYWLNKLAPYEVPEWALVRSTASSGC